MFSKYVRINFIKIAYIININKIQLIRLENRLKIYERQIIIR